MSAPALQVGGLTIGYRTATGVASAVSEVSLEVARGEIFGLVGESGCGKSTLAAATLGMLPGSAEVSGDIRVAGRSLAGMDAEALRGMRGNEVAIVVQDPLTSLDPTFSVGSQIVETIRAHRNVDKRTAHARAVELMSQVGIPEPERRFGDPPHRFSGGQRQRIVIAIALANEPALLIADEPTTALDVTIQKQILGLLRRLRDERGMAIVLITHDLAVVAETCDRVGVMYAGQLVEVTDAAALADGACHPYTRALLSALPTAEHEPGALTVIAGEIPDLESPPPGCRFAPRCTRRIDACARRPALTGGPDAVACWLHADAEHPVAETSR